MGVSGFGSWVLKELKFGVVGVFGERVAKRRWLPLHGTTTVSVLTVFLFGYRE